MRQGNSIPRKSLIGICLLVACGCGRDDLAKKSGDRSANPFAISAAGDATSKAGGQEARPSTRCSLFRDVHESANLRHVFLNGERGRALLMETTGGGAGWLDFDADGHWDLYLNQGGDSTAAADAPQPNDALFRNRGDGTFEDVTALAGIVELRFSQGVAIGDFDNDGFDDIYVTNLGRNTLFHNRGDGTFCDVTEHAGVGDERWSASAAWADLDLDGDLDLYVCNYCVYDPHNPRECRSEKGEPRICHPGEIPPWPDQCYFNQGDGTFVAETESRGLVDSGGRGLGVAVADFNNDGWPDIFVTNDTTANFYFVNLGHGRFEERAAVDGCATDFNGNTMANMGIGVNDLDNDGNLDLYITHFHMESDTLYRNYGPAGFRDESAVMGLRALTMDRLAFGVVMADFNQDGRMDVFTACGHIENSPGYPYYRMSPQLFAFDGRRWNDCSKNGGDYFRGKYVGRAAAACDYDEDGDVDLVVAQENDPAALLRNESERGHWLKFFMRGRESNRRGIGCRISLRAGSVTYTQELCGGTSYACTHQPSLIFGLGNWNQPCQVTVRWPSGRTQSLEGVALDRTLVLDEEQARLAPGDRGPRRTEPSAGKTEGQKEGK